MAIKVLLHLAIKPEEVEGTKETFKQILGDTRAFDGCIDVEVYQNQDDSNNITLIETWETREHQEKYIAWRTETGVMAALGDLVTAPPSMLFYDHVPTG